MSFPVLKRLLFIVAFAALGAASANPAAELLSEISGENARSYSTRDFGREKFDGAASVVLPQLEAIQLLRKLLSLPEGYLAYAGTTHRLGSSTSGLVEIVVTPGSTQDDIVRSAGTNGDNYDISNNDVALKIEQWERLYNARVISAETDSLSVLMVSPPTDMLKFAQEIYAFCPDTVDQGAGSLELLAKSLENTPLVIELWWD